MKAKYPGYDVVPLGSKRRQQRLAVPVTKGELAQAAQMARAGVDGASSSAELVRKLLAERFVRFVAQRAKRTKPDRIHGAAQGVAADSLIVSVPLVVGKPGRKGRARNGSADSAHGAVPNSLPQTTLPLVGPRKRAGHRAAAGA